MKEVRNWDGQTPTVSDKKSWITILGKSDNEDKVQYQINRSSFEKLSENPNQKYESKINNWMEK